MTLAFFLAGTILLLGFIGDYLFKKTKVPDILILIFLGFLLGPLTRVIEPSSLLSIAPLFASLALLIILFNGGLNLNLFKVIKDSPRAFVLASLGMFVSMLMTMLVAHFLLNWSWTEGLLLGAILGGASSSIVIPLISRMKVPEKVVTILSLESVFTDALVVVIGITLLQILQTATANGNEIMIMANKIASQFSIGIVVGMFVGVFWLRVLKSIQGQPYDDIVTLAVVMLFYAITESIGGNGAIFALIFGLVLGNGKEVSNMLRIKDPVEASKVMKKFHSQMSFLIRTFFFVYLGLLISPNNYMAFVYGALLTLLYFIGRYLATSIIAYKSPVIKSNTLLISSFLPRGLSAAVMAQIVLDAGLRNASLYSDIVAGTIVFSVVFASIFSFFLTKTPESS